MVAGADSMELDRHEGEVPANSGESGHHGPSRLEAPAAVRPALPQ